MGDLLLKIIQTKGICHLPKRNKLIQRTEDLILRGYKEYKKVEDKSDSNPIKKFYSDMVKNSILRLAKIGPRHKAIIYANMFEGKFPSDYASKLF